MINVLISRPYIKRGDLEFLRWCSRDAPMRLIVDCGAFTDFMAGRPAMPIAKYIDWLKAILPELADIGEMHGYMALDVIGDADATMRNYEVMLDAGLSPIPIMTRGVDHAHIERMVETAPSIALGGIFGTTTKERSALRWMINQLPEKFPAHWLGFTEPSFIRHYQPDSYDSSNWLRGSRWGILPTYKGDYEYGRQLKHGMMLTKEESRRIRLLGFDPAILALKRNWKPGSHFQAAHCISVAMYLEWMRDLAALGVKMFFALASIVRGLVYNLFHQYVNTTDGCIGQPKRKTIEWIIQNHASLSEVTPESTGLLCKHY